MADMTKAQHKKADTTAKRILKKAEEMADEVVLERHDIESNYTKFDRDWVMVFTRADVEYEVSVSAKRIG